jgi:hypothetical protein
MWSIRSIETFCIFAAGRRYASALRDWCRFFSAAGVYIEPGSPPWQNPNVESFGSRIRDGLLAVEQSPAWPRRRPKAGSSSWLPHRAMVWQADRQGHPPRRLSLSTRTHHRDRDLPHGQQLEPRAFVWTATAEQILTKVTTRPRHPHNNHHLNRDTCLALQSASADDVGDGA